MFRSIFVVSAGLLVNAFVHGSPLVRKSQSVDIDLADYLFKDAAGLRDSKIRTSAGGLALCVSGMVDVTASATNVKLNLEAPTNSSEVTGIWTDFFQTNSTFAKELFGGPHEVTGTYGIYSELCFPRTVDAIDGATIHFLIHGGGFDRSYWDPAPGYSYVDSAAEQGYATFLYDRLGNGLSDHPDPININQVPLQISIAHELISRLREGGFLNHSFQNIVGIGHSFGSAQMFGITTQFPHDLDAAVLTGFAAVATGQETGLAALNLAVASEVDPLRFAHLANGYLTASAPAGNQFFFFHAPDFDADIFNIAEATKQPIALGEFFSFDGVRAPTNFTGPVDVVMGENDFPMCSGNCMVPDNSAASLLQLGYPLAANGSSWFIATGVGHGINLHYAATAAYQHILDFVKKNGF